MLSAASILLLFAHPAYQGSRANRALLGRLNGLAHVQLRDLYECYPDFIIDVGTERALLCEHTVIIWQFPMYWYATPALLKEWQDLVLAYGFAYGRNGQQLAGKYLACAITVGGQADEYCDAGTHQYELTQFLLPLQQTAKLCKMRWLPPLVVFNSLRQTAAEREQAADAYQSWLTHLQAPERCQTQWAHCTLLNSQQVPFPIIL